MLDKKKVHPKEKTKLHPRNKHRERYDFKLLCDSFPELKPFVLVNNFNDESIDFFNPIAVKMLNKALLKQYYKIKHWDIPENYLCPPIPGRADYLHNLADLLSVNNNKIPIGATIKCLDIGVGANCVYPIIGNAEYGWSFVGSDIDTTSIQAATKIVSENSHLNNTIELRLQNNSSYVFKNAIKKNERFDVTICNPPFHSSLAEAQFGTKRKLTNLKANKVQLNFGGVSNELWCNGGELKFITDMINESKLFANSCLWFTTLVAKKEHLKPIYYALKNVEAFEVKTIPMGQGNKLSRIIAWTFLNIEEQQRWINSRE